MFQFKAVAIYGDQRFVAFGRSPKQVLSRAAAWLRSVCMTGPRVDQYGFKLYRGAREVGHLMRYPYCISSTYQFDAVRGCMDFVSWANGDRERYYYPDIYTSPIYY